MRSKGRNNRSCTCQICSRWVLKAAVVGVVDEKWGEVGRAFVVLKVGSAAAEMKLFDFCRAHLAKFKVPRSVVFLEVLPKNDAGKINRQALRQLSV